ncbi:MAG: carbamoyltransferase family protein, partial [Geminicoccaceae bacterium]
MRILGLSAFYHDSAAALLVDGELVAAAQEERFTRKKHDAAFPKNAVEYCLAEGGIGIDQVDHIAFYDKPFLKFERLLETYLAFAPKGFTSFRMALPVWLKEKLFQKRLLREHLQECGAGKEVEAKLLFTEHHQSHAASAFFPSPFEEGAVLTIDGVGEWATTSVGLGRGNRLEMLKELHFPHSLGLLYSAFTYYTGFKVNSGEYKIMGLAPYGEPKYARLIFDHLMDLKDDGTFRLNQDYFSYCTGLTMTNGKFDALFGGPPRKAEEPVRQRDMDLAASVQVATEEVMLRLTRALARETGQKNLCLAGGVALNCVANGKILRDGQFERIWIQPAAGDAGGAVGGAFAAYHLFKDQARRLNGVRDGMRGAYLGPAFAQGEIERRLAEVGAVFDVVSDDDMIASTVDALVDSKAVGWFQGRMEFGPRALGGRSILGDARSPTMQRTLNLKVKYRESFRPFAPSVLREAVADWFELDDDSPYMLLVADVIDHRRRLMNEDEQSLFGIDKLNVPRSQIPVVTHVDYSARIQTVHPDTNPRYHRLLSEFNERTGCPVLVNTSF